MADEPMPDTTIGNPSRPSGATSVEHNKAVSRRWIEVFNERDGQAEADVRAPEYVAYAPTSLESEPLDSEAWTRFLAGFVNGFPDLRITVEDAVGEGDLVAQRPLQGHPPGSFKGFHRPKARSHSSASSSTASSKDGSRSTGSNWTPSRFFDSWAWSSYQARGYCRASWPISLRSCARRPDEFFRS